MNKGVTTTEQESHYINLEKKSVSDLLKGINNEDQSVAKVIKKILPSIEKITEKIIKKMSLEGRLFYIGSGTSGRLGIVDASECPPTYGVNHGLVIGIIAGGDKAIRKAVEFAEDDLSQGWKDLQKHKVSKKDVVIGISASGTTPYVIGALEKCKKNKILTGAITCNAKSRIVEVADIPLVAVVGPEFVTGSTRMKAGTAQKLILNMISTAVMIKMGRVLDNKMVDMQLTNNKLIDRGAKLVMLKLKLKSYQKSKELLLKYGSVRKVLENY